MSLKYSSQRYKKVPLYESVPGRDNMQTAAARLEDPFNFCKCFRVVLDMLKNLVTDNNIKSIVIERDFIITHIDKAECIFICLNKPLLFAAFLDVLIIFYDIDSKRLKSLLSQMIDNPAFAASKIQYQCFSVNFRTQFSQHILKKVHLKAPIIPYTDFCVHCFVHRFPIFPICLKH